MMTDLTGQPKLVEPYFAAPGPWGRLEFSPFTISPPQDFAEAYRGLLGLESRTWNFPGLNHLSLTELLQQLRLRQSSIDQISSAAFSARTFEGMSVIPPTALVTHLTRTERGELYHWLSHHSAENASGNWQANAFRYCGSFDEWFANAPLQPQTIKLVEHFVYVRENYSLFADLPVVAEQLQEQREFAQLIKVLARENTLMAKLHFQPGDNIDEIAAYWSRGQNQDRARPMLESLAHSRPGNSLDIIHLLPNFVRRLLYTYPPFHNQTVEATRDCHWTSMNFFSEVPQDSMSNLNYVAEVVLRDWEQIYSQPMLGDLVFFQEERQNIFHSAVYVADDVLFTKNGPAIVRPWILMRESDLLGFYPQLTAVNVVYYRRKDLM